MSYPYNDYTLTDFAREMAHCDTLSNTIPEEDSGAFFDYREDLAIALGRLLGHKQRGWIVASDENTVDVQWWGFEAFPKTDAEKNTTDAEKSTLSNKLST